MPKNQDIFEPSERLLRIEEVLRFIPVSRPTWLRGVRGGRFPAPVRVGACVCWRWSDLLTFMREGAPLPARKRPESNELTE